MGVSLPSLFFSRLFPLCLLALCEPYRSGQSISGSSLGRVFGPTITVLVNVSRIVKSSGPRAFTDKLPTAGPFVKSRPLIRTSRFWSRIESTNDSISSLAPRWKLSQLETNKRVSSSVSFSFLPPPSPGEYSERGEKISKRVWHLQVTAQIRSKLILGHYFAIISNARI